MNNKMAAIRSVKFAIFALLASTTTYSNAAEQRGNPFATAWTQSCSFLVNKLVQQPDLQSVLDAKPIPFDVVCPCMKAKIQADPYIAVMLTNDEPNIEQKAQDPRFRPYFFAKLMSSVMVCAGPELEKSAKALVP